MAVSHNDDLSQGKRSSHVRAIVENCSNDDLSHWKRSSHVTTKERIEVLGVYNPLTALSSL